MTIQVYLYSAYYRMCVKFIPMKKLQEMLGNKGEESSFEASSTDYKMGKLIGFHVNRVTQHTLWESKCLVRAFTARKLLMKKGIPSTLYLGVGKVDGKMVAHAWLRVGQLYVTGGDGTGYACVAKFRNE